MTTVREAHTVAGLDAFGYDTIRPLQVLGVVPVDAHVLVRTPTRTLSINNHVDEVWAVLRYANGHLSTEEVLDTATAETGLERDTLTAVQSDLLRLGVLRDSRALHSHVMDWSDNPMPYSSDMRMSAWVEHENKLGWVADGERIALPDPEDASPWSARRSCRAFTPDPVATTELARILRHVSDHPVSGGGLYPVRLALVLRRTDGAVEPGMYHYDPAAHALVKAGEHCDEEMLFALNREDGIHDAPAVLVISGDFTRQTDKYANRGWRYTLIEAGVAVERVLGLALNADLSTLVFGGYDDVVLSRSLYGTDAADVRTVTVIAIGHPARASGTDLDLDELNAELDDLFVGENHIVESTGVTNLWRLPGDLSFHQVLATLRAPAGETGPHAEAKNRMCGGTAASIVAARAKAIVEAVERHASSTVRIDAEGPTAQMDQGIDVPKFIHLSPAQVHAQPFLAPFHPGTVLQWTSGTLLSTGEHVLVPVDLVNYPLSHKKLGRGLLVAANSSGIAAHTRDDEAVRRAFLELLERHAVLTSWHRQQAPTRIRRENLTAYLRSRAQHWEDQGHEMQLLDYSSNGIPIIGAVIGSQDQLPCFAFGSAAAGTWSQAATKALHEAEVGIAGHRSRPEEPIAVRDVHTPLDHGQLHAYDGARVALKFLLSGSLSAEAPVLAADDSHIESVMKTFDAIAVRIDSPEPIKTFRVLSPLVLPISFGSALEHRPAWSLAPNVPHFIA